MSIVYFLLRAVAVVAVCAYLAAGLFLYVFQARFLFPGAFMPFPLEAGNFAAANGFEEATIPAADGEKLFLLHRAPEPGKPVIILFHGNASYPESYGFLYAEWITAGYGIVAPVARGYPRSSGLAEGEKMQSDAIDLFDWATKIYPDHPIYVLGQSLGTSPAVHVAAHRPVAGVVLISPFQSMLSLVAEKIPYFPMSWLLKSPFRSDLDMPSITAPILIFHGDRDTLVPIASAQALAKTAKRPVEFNVIDGAGHAEGLFAPEMVERIARFFGTAP